MQIIIIDDSGVEESLDFLYRNSDHIVDFTGFNNYIKNIFTIQFNKIANLFELYNIKLNIRLEQSKQVSRNHFVLASFDVIRSNKEDFYFSIYMESIENLYQDYMNKKAPIDIDEASTILHELIHAADLTLLKEVIDEQKESQNLSLLKEANFGIVDLEEDNLDYNVQWSVLSYLNTFRAEGVAILSEKLFNHNKSILDHHESEKRFQKDLDELFDLYKNFNYHNRIENNKIYKKLNLLKLKAYEYADTMLFNLVKTQLNEFSTYENLESYINENNEEDSYFKKLTLIRYLLNFDLSDYINSIIRYKLDDGSKLLDPNDLYKYCFFLQKDNNNEGLSKFIQLINSSGYAKKKKLFIETMKSTIGYPMTKEEIFSEFKSFEKKNIQEDIYEDLVEIGKNLLNNFDKAPEIISWAMTYLLDDEDLIHDRIEYLGLQDDWIVLNATKLLIPYRES